MIDIIIAILIVIIIILLLLIIDKKLVDNIIENIVVDKQNSHDTQVISDLGKKYNRLVELYGTNDTENFIPDIREFYNRYCPNKMQNINKVLEQILKKQTIISLTNSEINELQIVNLIWKRINSHDNKTKNLLIDRFMENMENCIETGEDNDRELMEMLNIPREELVCINGRVARLLDTLTVIDPDPILGGVILTSIDVKEILLDNIIKYIEENVKINNNKELYNYIELNNKKIVLIMKNRFKYLSNKIEQYTIEVLNELKKEMLNN